MFTVRQGKVPKVHGVHCPGRRAREHPTGMRIPSTEAAVLGGFVASTLHPEKRPVWRRHGPTPQAPPRSHPHYPGTRRAPCLLGCAQRGVPTPPAITLAIKSLDSHFLLIYRYWLKATKGCGMFGRPCRPLIADNEQSSGSWEQGQCVHVPGAFPGTLSAFCGQVASSRTGTFEHPGLFDGL